MAWMRGVFSVLFVFSRCAWASIPRGHPTQKASDRPAGLKQFEGSRLDRGAASSPLHSPREDKTLGVLIDGDGQISSEETSILEARLSKEQATLPGEVQYAEEKGALGRWDGPRVEHQFPSVAQALVDSNTTSGFRRIKSGWLDLRRRHPIFQKISSGFKKTVSTVTSHVKNAVNTIGKHIKGAFEKIAGTFKGAFKWLNTMLRSFKMLMGIVKCIDKLDMKWHLRGLLEFTASFKGDMIAFAKGFVNKYVMPAVTAASNFVNSLLSGGVNNIKGVLSDGMVPFDQMKGGAWVKTLVDDVWMQVQTLSKKPGLEPMVCLVDFVLKPAFEALKTPVVDAVTRIVQMIQSTWDKLVKEASGFVTGAINTFVNANPQAKTLLDSINDVVAVDCMERMEKLGQSVADYSNEIANGTSKSNKAKFDELWASLTDPSLGVLQKISAVAISKMLEWFWGILIQYVVSPIMGKAVDVLSSMLSWGFHAVDGLCGLAPEAGAAICGAVCSGLKSAETWVSTTLYDLGLKSIKAVFKMIGSYVVKFVDTVLSAVLNNDLMKGALRLFKPIVNAVMGFAKFSVPGVKEKLKKCDATKQAIANVLKSTAQAAGAI